MSETKETTEKVGQQEEAVDNIDALRNKHAQQMEELGEIYDKLFQELEEGNYLSHGYDDEGAVVIPAPLFSSFVNFLNSSMQTHYSIGNTLSVLQSSNDALITDLTRMTIRVMKQHKANVDNGATKTSEELDELDAKKNIQEVPKPEKKTKKKRGEKARGTK